MKGLTKYGSQPIIIGYHDMVKHKMTTIFKEYSIKLHSIESNPGAHEEEVEISETHTTENFDIKSTGPRDTYACISANDIKASSGRTSAHQLSSRSSREKPLLS